MSDVPATPTQDPAPAAEPVVAPVAAVVAPVVPDTPSEASPAETAPGRPPEVVPAVDGASDTPPVPLHTDEPGLLAATEPAKPADPAAKPETAAADPALEPTPIVYEPFALPEGLAPTEQLTKYAELAAANRIPQEAAQQFIDMHIAEVQRLQENTLADQHRAFAETRREWRNQIMSDEELGGAGFETNRSAAQRMLNTFVPEQHREAFNNALLLTGASDNPEIFRFLVNLARKFDEPTPSPLPNGPPPDIARSPSSGRRLNYDNPTSPRSNGVG